MNSCTCNRLIHYVCHVCASPGPTNIGPRQGPADSSQFETRVSALSAVWLAWLVWLVWLVWRAWLTAAHGRSRRSAAMALLAGDRCGQAALGMDTRCGGPTCLLVATSSFLF